MKTNLFLSLLVVSFVVCMAGMSYASQTPADPAPKPDEQQLPRAMHSAMEELPLVTVGRENAQLIGSDNRVLQAAVDYIAALGGGTVAIGPGEYLMYDSLHLRSNVAVKGSKGKTILRKADGAVSLLALDGDFGEQRSMSNTSGKRSTSASSRSR